MFWVVNVSILILLKWLSHDKLWELFVDCFGALVLTVGLFGLPHIHVVHPDGTVERKRAVLPYRRLEIDGVEFRPGLCKTYIVNSGNLPIRDRLVYYTEDKELMSDRYHVEPDTPTGPLLIYPQENVAPFTEAPMVFYTVEQYRIVTEIVHVLALPGQNLESFEETRYRRVELSPIASLADPPY